MNKIINVSLVLSLLAFTLLGAFSNPTYAQSENNDFANELQKFSQNAIELNQTKSEKIYDDAKNKIKEQNMVIHADLQEVKNYKVYKFKDSNQKLVNIVIGSESGKFHTYNVLLKDNSVKYYDEMILTKVNNETGHIKSYANGKLNKDKEYDVPNDNAQISDGFQTLGIGSWWGAFNDCMKNDMQVPGWVITGISIACSAVCIGTAGAGCVGCVTAAASGFSFDVGYCVGYANDYF
ncbi:hypothetical protein [Salimicrobium flavidum]|uniref:Uncharacterized protein n=1 Tax=Salimicrobium flavidum TaxID=570947 RepID=A0A1N7ISE1_9BACI|nr:hypothetical protein [Salimicrobium flavidum]SIS39960.1 hypothetical protein SAMN05421687_10294 [Salimicrobium flavidum]